MPIDNPDDLPPLSETARLATLQADIDHWNAKAARLNAQAAESDRKTRRNLRIMDIGVAGQAFSAAAIVAICFFHPTPPMFPLVQAMATLFFCGVYTAVGRRTLGMPIVALSTVTMATAAGPLFWEAFRRMP